MNQLLLVKLLHNVCDVFLQLVAMVVRCTDTSMLWLCYIRPSGFLQHIILIWTIGM